MRKQLAEQLDDRLARPMFLASLGFLALLAGSLQAARGGSLMPHAAQLHAQALLLLWPLFIAECAARLLLGSPRWKQYLVFALLPPLRIGARDQQTGHSIWVPRLGWRRCSREFRQQTERAFSLPMMLLALLVVPVLAIELFWYQESLLNPYLSFALDTGTSLIWLGFAIELIVMVSIVEKRVLYCKTHWIDIAIVVLPFLAFLRMLRFGQLVRLVRLQEVGRLSRVYRLRGMATRAYRGVLVLNIIRYFVRGNPHKRIQTLRELVREKQFEIEDLLAEIRELEAQCAAAVERQISAPPVIEPSAPPGDAMPQAVALSEPVAADGR